MIDFVVMILSVRMNCYPVIVKNIDGRGRSLGPGSPTCNRLLDNELALLTAAVP